MMNFTLVSALLYIFSCISVSLSEFHNVEVQPGEDATLKCTNFSKMPFHITWFRLSNEPNISRIASMLKPDSITVFYYGFQNGRFIMTSNITTIFLHITQVDFSDSGLYFCGSYEEGKAIIVHATYLNATQRFGSVIILILGGLIICLFIVIFGLAVKIIRLHKALDQNPSSQSKERRPSETLGSDALNYASVNFKLKPNRRPVSETQQEENVVYSSTR